VFVLTPILGGKKKATDIKIQRTQRSNKKSLSKDMSVATIGGRIAQEQPKKMPMGLTVIIRKKTPCTKR
jgi:hypothetical protein